MSVYYSGLKPERNFSIRDFHANGVTLTSFHHWRDRRSNKHHISCIFRSHGFMGTIRTTYYGNAFAIDVVWGKPHGLHPNDKCLTTECKTLREAKSILFVWFRSHGFKVSSDITVQPRVAFKHFQVTVSPFLL